MNKAVQPNRGTGQDMKVQDSINMLVIQHKTR